MEVLFSGLPCWNFPRSTEREPGVLDIRYVTPALSLEPSNFSSRPPYRKHLRQYSKYYRAPVFHIIVLDENREGAHHHLEWQNNIRESLGNLDGCPRRSTYRSPTRFFDDPGSSNTTSPRSRDEETIGGGTTFDRVARVLWSLVP